MGKEFRMGNDTGAALFPYESFSPPRIGIAAANILPERSGGAGRSKVNGARFVFTRAMGGRRPPPAGSGV